MAEKESFDRTYENSCDLLSRNVTGKRESATAHAPLLLAPKGCTGPRLVAVFLQRNAAPEPSAPWHSPSRAASLGYSLVKCSVEDHSTLGI